MAGVTADIVARLQSEILRLQGFTSLNCKYVDFALGPIAAALPNASLPLGAMHEFVTSQPNDQAATTGFISGLLSPLLSNKGIGMWISCSRTLFPPALKLFGIDPDRFIFIDLKKEKDTLWAMEEALKCASPSAVVAEVSDISFTASRRLQLAVEKSQVTGFILRPSKIKLSTSACVTRWRISSLPSITTDIPGIGFPQWKVELLKIKNGRPGVWNIQWVNGKFLSVNGSNSSSETGSESQLEFQQKQTG